MLRVIGANTVGVGKVTFDVPGDYYYEVFEIKGSETYYTYDKTVYWCKYEIRLNEAENALVVSRFVIKDGGANGKVIYEGTDPQNLTFDFVNTYIPDSPPPDDTTTVDTTTDETTPDETTVPEDTTTDETTPDETTVPEDTTTDETTPDETTPDETTPDETTVPEDTTTDETTPVDTYPTPPNGDNSYVPPAKPILPQTGQVWWPVIVFGIIGAIFVIAGVSVSRRGRKDD